MVWIVSFHNPLTVQIATLRDSTLLRFISDPTVDIILSCHCPVIRHCGHIVASLEHKLSAPRDDAYMRSAPQSAHCDMHVHRRGRRRGRELVASPASESLGKGTGKNEGNIPSSIDAFGTGVKSKSPSSGRLQVKTNAQAHPRVNGTRVGVMDGLKTEDELTSSPPARTFINQLPDWSMLLAAVTTLFLAAEKQWMMLDWKPKRLDMVDDPFGLGSIMHNGLIFRQNFSIRSYEIGADRTVSVETLMNHLQETALNHVKTAGLLNDGFGSTPEMCKRNLIWVVAKMQVLVDRYPTWGDVIQVDTWVAASGKNGMRRDWLIRDRNTGDILTRASSQWVMMNKETRRLAKIPDEVRDEIGGYFVDSPPVVDQETRKLPKLDNTTADYIRTGLTSAPLPVVETHELAGITLEYRRECTRDSVLESLCSVLDKGIGDLANPGFVECQHLLRLEGGGEVIKGRTEWRPKHADRIGSMSQHPTGSV
ncbi:palmitoyl-acyl carrier protein thioesterase, chloroplastic-like [Dorcoceras hygrometricum]|nr:palmitoyl-acyl carrier protein thioesterase, chloroplastic-like [Dorcoceras hygrometricum]